jgi:hypothetical protein
MRYFEIINEAKFRKPNVMFHGTSTAFLQSILKNGMVPTPKSKSWDTDPDVSIRSQSRVSLEGSYWTSNLLTATSSAWRTSNKFKGEELIIIAQIQEQQAFADEDSVTYKIDAAFANAMGSGIYSERPDILAQTYYDNPTHMDQARIKFQNILHNNLTSNEKKPIPEKIIKDLFDSYILRIIAHGEKESGGKEWYSPLYRVKNKPESIPTVDMAEHDLLQKKDVITKYYTETAYEKDGYSFSHTLRITEPVTYSGANKILFVIERDKKLQNLPLKLHYGNPPLPNKFIEQWHSRIGDFPGLMTPDGKMLQEPSKRER